MRIRASTVDRQTRIAGIVGAMLVASIRTSGAVAAAEPTNAPEQGTVTIVATDGSQPVLSSGSVAAQPVFIGGDLSAACGEPMIIGIAPDGTQTIEQGPPDVSCSQGVITIGGPTFGDRGDFVVGDPWEKPHPGSAPAHTLAGNPGGGRTRQRRDGQPAG